LCVPERFVRAYKSQTAAVTARSKEKRRKQKMQKELVNTKKRGEARKEKEGRRDRRKKEDREKRLTQSASPASLRTQTISLWSQL